VALPGLLASDVSVPEASSAATRALSKSAQASVAAIERPGVTEEMRQFAKAWTAAPRAADVVPSFFEKYAVPEKVERALLDPVVHRHRDEVFQFGRRVCRA
jgi:hypothetical protein